MINNTMDEIFDILESLENTSSRLEKERILIDNKDNEALKSVLYYALNPYMIYGIGKKSIKAVDFKPEFTFTDIFSLLDYLLIHNGGSNKDISIVVYFLLQSGARARNWYERMLLKDLRIGVESKTVNKIFPKLIPVFNVMLAMKYFEKENKVKGKFIITKKLDGVRCVILKENGNTTIMSRQGHPFEGLIEIEEDAKSLPDNFAYDGELLAFNPDNIPSKDLYRKTMTLATKDGIKVGLCHNCFDMIPIDEFKEGISKDDCITRKTMMHEILDSLHLNTIVEVPILYYGDDKEMIIRLLDEAIAKGDEGVMVNLADKPYKCARTDYILKCKRMNTIDLKILDFIEGEGKFGGTLGATIVDYKGNFLGVGSGYSDSDRNYIWNHREDLKGTIMEVQYFEETTNMKNDAKSLRFPVFVRLRTDKNTVSYN